MPLKSWPDPSNVNRIMAKVKSDDAFKSQLLRDANGALATLGIEVPQGITVKVHEDTATTLNFVLPPLSRGAELSDETLEAVVGGADNPSGAKGAIRAH